jgi:hypothetical protein
MHKIMTEGLPMTTKPKAERPAAQPGIAFDKLTEALDDALVMLTTLRDEGITRTSPPLRSLVAGIQQKRDAAMKLRDAEQPGTPPTKPEIYLTNDWERTIWNDGRLVGMAEGMQYERKQADKFIETAGIVEIAVRNSSVAEYIKHWEGRAEAAERKLAERETPTCSMCRVGDPREFKDGRWQHYLIGDDPEWRDCKVAEREAPAPQPATCPQCGSDDKKQPKFVSWRATHGKCKVVCPNQWHVEAPAQIPGTDQKFRTFVEKWVTVGSITGEYAVAQALKTAYDFGAASSLEPAATLELKRQIEVAHNVLRQSWRGKTMPSDAPPRVR